jgi:hypothetical protein
MNERSGEALPLGISISAAHGITPTPESSANWKLARTAFWEVGMPLQAKQLKLALMLGAPPMNPFFYSEEAGAKGLPPLSPAPPIPAEPASASLRTISLDDSEHLLHNHHASVAALRLLFTFAPERRSASFRNRCSPSPEYPVILIAQADFEDEVSGELLRLKFRVP